MTYDSPGSSGALGLRGSISSTGLEKFNVLTAIPRSKLPKGTKAMSTTWAIKKKANGKLQGRLNAYGYEQVEGIYYYADYIAATVANPNSLRLLLTLLAMNPDWKAELIGVEGAFLQGKFIDGEELFIEVP